MKKTITLIVIIILLILYFGGGYIPIVGRIISYISAYKYFEGDSILNVSYNIVDRGYNVFSGYNKVNVDLSKGLIYDEKLNGEKIKDKYAGIKNLIENNFGVDMPESIFVSTACDMWDKEVFYHRIYVLGVCSENNIHKEQSENMPAKLANEIIKNLGTDGKICGIQLSYFDNNGYYELSVPLNKNKRLTYKLLQDNTMSLSPKLYPQDYIEWKMRFVNNDE